MRTTDLTAGQLASLACLREATASKPGNVHRGADFEDTTFEDFVTSGVLLGHAIDNPRNTSIGQQILEAVRATQATVRSNTNLGMVLLLVPLANAYAQRSFESPFDRGQLVAQLDGLPKEDCHLVYEAIRVSKPGGLGQADTADVRYTAPDDLIAAMSLAADRDQVAAQYANGFEDIFEFVAPTLNQFYKITSNLTYAIILSHLETMAKFPDSLIGRKCGPETAHLAAAKAQDVMGRWTDRSNQPTPDFWNEVAEFDFWLRSDGHRRNPGTTADLIASGIFVAMATGGLPIH